MPSGITKHAWGNKTINSLKILNDITLPTEAQEVTIPMVDMARDIGSGTPDYNNGQITYSASTTSFWSMPQFFPFKQLGASIKIESIIIYLSSTNNSAYLSWFAIESYPQNVAVGGNTPQSDFDDMSDYGYLSVGDHVATYAPDLTLEADRSYRMRTGVIAVAGACTLNCMEIKYTLV